MRKIGYKYTYYNVGQGLFHSGKIGDFTFVYDCGSFNKDALIKSITDYRKNNIHNIHKYIDLLVLSHFDADHINGLDMLLDEVKVDTVVIPYISLVDRIIIASKSQNKDQEDWYYLFMYDNITYLKNKGVKNIVVINHDDDSTLTLDNDINLDNNSDLTLEWGKMVETTLPKNNILDNNSGDSDFQVFNDSGHIMLSNMWVFKFYAQEISEKIKDNSKVKKRKNNKASKPTRERFLQILKSKKIIDKSKPINEQIKKAIMNPTLRSKIVDAYRTISKDLNYTSLMMYNGPLGRYNNEPKYYTYTYQPKMIVASYLRNVRYLKTNDEGIFGQLMTGDAFINTQKKYQDFKNHFGWLLKKAIVVLAPHHGSHRNWNGSILASCTNAWLWVASAGFSNNYAHPSYEVVMDILKHNRAFIKCDEFIRIYMIGEIKWM